MKIQKEELVKIIKQEAKKVLGEGRYKRSRSSLDDPRAQAMEKAIDLLDDLVYDSLEDDIAEYADEAVRALSKAIQELDYKRNQVGNLEEGEK